VTFFRRSSTIFLIFLCCFLAYRAFMPILPLLDDSRFSQAIYDEQHQLLRLTLSSDDKYRVYTPLSEISPLLIQATLLQEDQYFFLHPGINPFAILKAAWQTYVLRARQFGASTITMQLARMRDGIHSKNMTGKLWQILKALQLELFYSKKQILEAYLNLASYGSNIEGIGAASLVYFNKPASQLNLAEALRLSVVPQNPTRRLPNLLHQGDLQNAYHKLFRRWMAYHPEDEALHDLIHLPWQLAKKNLPFRAPHFVESILRTNHHPKVVSTLNLKLQTLIEKITRNYLEQHQLDGMNNAAVLLVDTRDMGVKALIGSGNYFDSSICGQVNGTKVKLSPGSTLKPFIYALAMDQGIIHPSTVLKDAPSHFGDYHPENFDKDFLGPIQAKEALILSLNIPAIDLANQLKNPTLYQFLQQARISCLKPERDYGLSLVLGGAEVTMEELATLYAMLANQGVWKPIRTHAEVLLEGPRLLSPEVSFLTLDMLRDTPRPYVTNAAMNKQFPVYWKTGTSSGYRDAWTAGVFGPYVLVLWIGDFTRKSQSSFVGATAAAPLFFNIVDAVSQQMENLPDLVKVTPQMNLAKVQVCAASGLLPNRCCPQTISTWFIPGKSPIKTDHIHREIAINSQTGLRTCRIDQNTQFRVYEFWSSDILKIFAQAGMQRNVPPPFDLDCSLMDNGEGEPPKIISPQQSLFYILALNQLDHRLSFYATAETDVKTLYWFVNHDFIGHCEREQSLDWQAKSGTYVVRVVDDHGRTAVRDLVVQVVE
jgi:penicillin-binding protein 1C